MILLKKSSLLYCMVFMNFLFSMESKKFEQKRLVNCIVHTWQFTVSEELIAYSKTLASILAKKKFSIEDGQLAKIEINEISRKTFHSILKLLTIFHKQILHQKNGLITDRTKLIIGDDKVVVKDYIVRKNLFTIFDSILGRKTVEDLQLIIKAMHFLDIDFVDVAIAYWIISYIRDTYEIDYVTGYQNVFYDQQTRNEIRDYFYAHFPKDLHQLFLEQFSYVRNLYYYSKDHLSICTLTDYVLLTGDLEKFSVDNVVIDNYTYDLISLKYFEKIVGWYEWAKKITSLDLSYNLLSTIPIDFLNSFLTLKELKLQGNKLKGFLAIQSETLESLNLKKNKLKQISLDCPNLKKINLRKNKIEDISFLENHMNLLDITIDNNHIADIPVNLFSKLLLIEKLCLRDNPLCKKIAYVDFERNYLKDNKNIILKLN